MPRRAAAPRRGRHRGRRRLASTATSPRHLARPCGRRPDRARRRRARLPSRGVRPHRLALRPVDEGLRRRPASPAAARPHGRAAADPRRDRGSRRAGRARAVVDPGAHRRRPCRPSTSPPGRFVRDASDGLPVRWQQAVEDAVDGGDGALADALDQAMIGTSLRARRPVWWFSSTSSSGFSGSWRSRGSSGSPCCGCWALLQLPRPETPAVGILPVPLVMLVGGVLLGSGARRAVSVVGAHRGPAPAHGHRRTAHRVRRGGGRRAHRHARSTRSSCVTARPASTSTPRRAEGSPRSPAGREWAPSGRGRSPSRRVPGTAASVHTPEVCRRVVHRRAAGPVCACCCQSDSGSRRRRGRPDRAEEHGDERDPHHRARQRRDRAGRAHRSQRQHLHDLPGRARRPADAPPTAATSTATRASTASSPSTRSPPTPPSALRKGQPVIVEGNLAIKQYVGNDGQPRTSAEIDADHIGSRPVVGSGDVRAGEPGGGARPRPHRRPGRPGQPPRAGTGRGLGAEVVRPAHVDADGVVPDDYDPDAEDYDPGAEPAERRRATRARAPRPTDGPRVTPRPTTTRWCRPVSA